MFSNSTDELTCLETRACVVIDILEFEMVSKEVESYLKCVKCSKVIFLLAAGSTITFIPDSIRLT